MLTNLSWWLRTKNNILARVMFRILQFLSGAYISPNTVFANRPCFPHGMHGIFTSGNAEIGKECVIFQNVTIGSDTLSGSEVGSPVIGDGCYIGAGATIIGAVTLGDNVRVGANSTVYKDVPSNSVVVSAVQRNIQKQDVLDNRHRMKIKGEWYYWQGGQYHREKPQ